MAGGGGRRAGQTPNHLGVYLGFRPQMVLGLIILVQNNNNNNNNNNGWGGGRGREAESNPKPFGGLFGPRPQIMYPGVNYSFWGALCPHQYIKRTPSWFANLNLSTPAYKTIGSHSGKFLSCFPECTLPCRFAI